MPKKGSKRNGGRGAVSTTHAPSMNNMQQVEKWTLFDLVPVFIQTGQLGVSTVLQIQAGTNGWNYTLTQAATQVGNDSGLYGQLSGQFAQLSQVWQTYRLDHVMLEFTPSNFAGEGQASPMASIVDAAGLPLPQGPIDLAEQVAFRFSRSRTLQVVRPYDKSIRNVSYHNWLVQTVPEPWLLTQNGTAIDGRQLYPDTLDEQRTPVIRMVGQYIAPVANQLIGFIRVAASITVRGRRLDPVSVSGIRQLMISGDISMKDLLVEESKDEKS